MSIFKDKIFYIVSYFVVLLIFLIIANPSHYYFLNDDFIHIPLAAKGRFFHGGSLLRPISDFSLWVDHTFWKKNAYGYHLTNISIHLLNSVLVFFVVRKIYDQFNCSTKCSIKKSWFISILFLVYAFHSESIFWILGRGASLCTTFFLISFLFYINGKPSSANYLLCLTSFLLGLFTYEVIWIFPLIAVLMFFYFPNRRNLFYLCSIWIVFVSFLIVKSSIAGSIGSEYELRSLLEFNVIKLVYNFNTLLARCFLPPLENSLLFLALYILLLFISGLFIYKLRKNGIVIFSAICLVVSILPAVPIGIDTHDSESERFIYLASFFAIILTIEFSSFINRRASLSIVFVLLVGHLWLLFNAAESYKVGSLFAKQSLSCIDNNKNFENIYLYNLPIQYKGALIFRIGFKEAIEWINGIESANVSILSDKEIYRSYDTFFCSQAGLKNIDSMTSEVFRTSIVKAQSNDLILIWNNNSVKVFK